MSKEYPLVSVICLCYNQAKYVVMAVESVLDQDYENIELIVIDDASTDNSQQVIKDYLEDKPLIKSILLKENLGNCSAFNQGFKLSKGKYIIDLAGDDILLPGRIARGVKVLEEKDVDYGVHFCDAQIIDQKGDLVREHHTADFLNPVPEGYIFKELLGKYFINPITMMIARKVLDDMGGYDESLAYEDFDLWVRSSKQFKYCYSPEILVAKRKLEGSYSSKQYIFRSRILASTYQVCEKAYNLCETVDEFLALRKRVNFELKKAFQSFNPHLGIKFYRLRKKVMARLRELS